MTPPPRRSTQRRPSGLSITSATSESSSSRAIAGPIAVRSIRMVRAATDGRASGCGDTVALLLIRPLAGRVTCLLARPHLLRDLAKKDAAPLQPPAERLDI